MSQCDDFFRLAASRLGDRRSIGLAQLLQWTGLRPAEARGLLLDDLDLNGRTLTVTGQLDRQNRRTSPKTKKARARSNSTMPR